MKKTIMALTVVLAIGVNAQSVTVDTLVKNSNLNGFLLHYGADSAFVNSYTITTNTWGTGAGIEPFRSGSVPNYSNIGGSGLILRKSTNTGPAAGLLDTVIYNTSTIDSVIVGAFLNLSSGDSVTAAASQASGYYVLNRIHNTNHNTSIYIALQVYLDDNVPLAINELNILTYSHTSAAGIGQVKNTDEDVSIYPNPAGDNLIIKYHLTGGVAKGELLIYNAQGVQINSYPLDGTYNSLSLSNTGLAGGTYFYQLKTDKGFSAAKKLFVVK